MDQPTEFFKNILLNFIFITIRSYVSIFSQHIPHIVVGIQTIGDRILVSDVQESVHFVKYRRSENQLVIFADDTSPRYVTSTCIMDYQTVAIADKFGNISVVRLPGNVNDNVDEDPTGTKALWDRGLLNGASQKAECICVIHIGEIALSLQVTLFAQKFTDFLKIYT